MLASGGVGWRGHSAKGDTRRVIGIDAYKLDRPFANMVADYKRTGDGCFIWPAHFAGIEREYCQIEKLTT